MLGYVRGGGGGEGDRGRLRGESRSSGLVNREERCDEAVDGERDDRRDRGGGERDTSPR